VVTVAVVLMGALLPKSVVIAGRLSPASLALLAIWIGGVWVLNGVRSRPKWEIVMPHSRPGRPHRRVRHPKEVPAPATGSARTAIAVFAIASAVTLVAGVGLEVTGSTIATRAGINGVIFGATALALATALPEISSGIAAVRLGDHQLAVADVFGGNSFQVCLFLLADLVAGKPVLPTVGRLDSWLAALAVALTILFTFGVVARPRHCFARLGTDSILAVVVFGLGIAGLFALPH